jgi:hypothetical protein
MRHLTIQAPPRRSSATHQGASSARYALSALCALTLVACGEEAPQEQGTQGAVGGVEAGELPFGGDNSSGGGASSGGSSSGGSSSGGSSSGGSSSGGSSSGGSSSGGSSSGGSSSGGSSGATGGDEGVETLTERPFLNHPTCALPEYGFPETHPFALGQEAPRPSSKEDEDLGWRESLRARYDDPARAVAHLDPYAPALRDVPWSQALSALGLVVEGALVGPKDESLVLPGHVDTMPIFERAEEWTGPRCYEVAPGEGRLLSEEDAYQLYARLVSRTLWREVSSAPERRTVVGLRGAYPGRISWHHNTPNLFNDTLALIWRDAAGVAHVREFPVNTDTGAHDFGADSSSSLRPNRHYPYTNGWHRGYNALQMALSSYPVRDDTNNNGHWDSDRNGWLEGPEAGLDYDRLGSAHNIHGGQIDAPLRSAPVDVASAGCQVVPGAVNWLSFISQAWTGLGDSVDYFLIDARDISPSVYAPCETLDGTHACPYEVRALPYSDQNSTALSTERRYDRYSCAAETDEGGAERVYVLNLRESGLLRATLEVAEEGVDPDLHLLEGDDPRACRARGHTVVEERLTPGRYVLIVDTWVSASGVEQAGAYDLLLEWSAD